MNGGKPCGRYSQAIPVRFTYKIAFTISRRSCTGSLRPRPASARAARQAARIGSTNAHRGSDRSLRYARREVMTAIFSRSGTESAGPRTQKYLPAETDRDHSGSDALLDHFRGSAGGMRVLFPVEAGRLGDMQVLYERCAAVDVGKDVIAVAVRLPGDGPDGRATDKRTFKTFYGVLREAARWLSSLGVTHVAMEATGIYSMPVYHALIEHGNFAQVLVCNAGHVKNVPGRKTDLADGESLVHLLECGLLRGSFLPPADIKAARDVIRYRAKIVQSPTSELQRLGNVLQDAGIKIDSVASSIATKSGRAMIEALIDGERRPQVLADLAWARCGPRSWIWHWRWKAGSVTITP